MRFRPMLLLTAVLVLGVMLSGASPAHAKSKLPPDLRPDMFKETQYAVLRDAFADRDKVRPGEQFTLAVRLSPFDNGVIKFHTYGAEPSADFMYLPSAFVMDIADRVEWAAPVFPPGQEHEGQMWLTGQPVITISGKLSPEAQPGKRTFTGKLSISACTTEMCLPPSDIPITWEIEVVPKDYAGEIKVLSEAELKKSAKVDMSRYTLPEAEKEEPAVINWVDEPGGVELELLKTQAGGGKQLALWIALLLALGGGLLLNVMPCVLPVVSIKVISLVRNVEEDPKSVVPHGLAFSAGIIATFLAGAAVIAAIQLAGSQFDWGGQFQSPPFNIAMASVMFIFALSLAGVFTIKPPKALTEGGAQLADKEGYAGSFFKGVLATVLGTPCVGPFLGPALGYALTRTWVETLLIFAVIGLGMALPYVLILPFIARMGRRERGQLSRKLQDSKERLVDFERVMAFLLFITVVYLMSIIEGLMGGKAIIWMLVYLVGVAFACWAWGRLITVRKGGVVLALLAAIVVFGLTSWFAWPRMFSNMTLARAADTQIEDQVRELRGALVENGIDPREIGKNADKWEEFSFEKLDKYAAEGKTVLVDFTADWCPNCKTNEAFSLRVPGTEELADKLGVKLMVADYTERSEEIGRVLRALGYASVPLTAVFPGKDPNHPVLLDGLFTASRIQSVMTKAVK
jgi:thiol:disulfide interchange protein